MKNKTLFSAKLGLFALILSSSVVSANSLNSSTDIIHLKMSEVTYNLDNFSRVRTNSYPEILDSREPIRRNFRILAYRIKMQKEDPQLIEEYYNLLTKLGETKAERLLFNFSVGDYIYSIGPQEYFSLFLTDLNKLNIESMDLLQRLVMAAAKLRGFNRDAFYSDYIPRIRNIFQARTILMGIKHGQYHDRFFENAIQITNSLQQEIFELLMNSGYSQSKEFYTTALRVKNYGQFVAFQQGVIQKNSDINYYLNSLERYSNNSF